MPHKSDRHSRRVGRLKVILPLAALGLLSSMFLFSNRINLDAALEYSELDVKELSDHPRMNLPEYSGLTSDGTTISMTAQSARPTPQAPEAATDHAATTSAANSLPDAQEVQVDMQMPDGGRADIRADRAALDHGANELHLEGNVVMNSSTGYQITMPQMTTALDYSAAHSDGPTMATGPSTTINAQAFTFTHQGKVAPSTEATAPALAPPQSDDEKNHAAGQDIGDPYLLIFSGGVKLIYEPPAQ